MINGQNFFQKSLKKIQLYSNDLLFAAGFWQAEKILSKSGRRILIYHGLDKAGDKTLNGRFIAAADFELQVRYLSDHAQIVSLSDYFSEKFDEKKFTVAITFDDGYQNNVRYALPVLEQYKAPATFFLTAAAGRGAAWLWMDFLDIATRLGPEKMEIDNRIFRKKKWRHSTWFADSEGRKLSDWARYSHWQFVQKMETAFQAAGAWHAADVFSEYWKLLDSGEIRRLAASACANIGAHGYTHQDLEVLSHEAACQELYNCKAALESICGVPVRALAYPFGAYTRELVDYAEKIGFSQQLAVDFLFPEDSGDLRLRERMGMNPYISNNNQWVALKKGRY